MKNHVTTLETSKRLKELGVPQESEFWWASLAAGKQVLYASELEADPDNGQDLWGRVICSAPLATYFSAKSAKSIIDQRYRSCYDLWVT